MSYIVWLHPICGLPQHMLEPVSYFSLADIQTGSIVPIIFGKKKISGLVVQTEPLKRAKIRIKSSKINLKKITNSSCGNVVLPRQFINILNEYSEYYREPAGFLLSKLLPLKPAQYAPAKIKTSKLATDKFYAYPLQERVALYKTLSSGIKRNENIIVCAPTVKYVEYLHRAVAIKNGKLLFHGKLSKTKLEKSIAIAQSENSCKLVVSTPAYMPQIMLALRERAHIIVDSPESPHFIRSERPRINMKNLIRALAGKFSISYAEYGSSPGISSLAHNNTANVWPAPKKRFVKIINNADAKQAVGASLLEYISRSPEKCMVFVSRKGYYTTLICADCGEPVKCGTCGIPISLYESGKMVSFCKICNKHFQTGVKCTNCASWNLKGYGIGTQLAAHTLSKKIPDRQVLILDKKTARNNNIIEKFNKSKNGILVGTEMLLEFPELCAQTVCVANLDNLFSIPDYSINVRVYSILTRLEEKSAGNFIIQTKYPEHPVFNYFASGNAAGFYRHELDDRKLGRLPPYSVLIRVTLQSKNAKRLQSTVRSLKTKLANIAIPLQSYPSYTESSKHHILITADKNYWRKNAEKLKSAIRGLDIAVDPINVL